MLCERCKQSTASVQYTHTINGKSASYALCQSCYHQLSGDHSALFSDFFFPLAGMNSQSRQACDLCGYTLDSIRKEGRVGCARCYSTFRAELKELIGRIHGNKCHISDTSELKINPTLEELLQKAIREENYEEAIILRDRINAEKEGKNDVV